MRSLKSLIIAALLPSFVKAAALPLTDKTTPAELTLPSPDRWQPDRGDHLNLKIGFVAPSLNMTTNGDGANSVTFLPNTSQKTVVGVGYRNLGFYLSKSNPRTSEQVDQYGTGDSTDVLVQFFGRRWTQQYYYQSYSGYYIPNAGALDPTYAVTGVIKRPDIQTAHYGLNFTYNFQPANYSLGAAFNQSGRQLRSGGAWLATGSFHNHIFRSEPQLLPNKVAPEYKELATLEKGDLLQVGVSVGGGYSWVFFESWYLTGQFLIGTGSVYQNFETADYIYKKNAFATVASGAFGFGYNGVNNYFSLQVLTDTSTYPLPSLSMQISTTQTAIVFGRRFEGVSLPWADRWSSWLD